MATSKTKASKVAKRARGPTGPCGQGQLRDDKSTSLAWAGRGRGGRRDATRGPDRTGPCARHAAGRCCPVARARVGEGQGILLSPPMRAHAPLRSLPPRIAVSPGIICPPPSRPGHRRTVQETGRSGFLPSSGRAAAARPGSVPSLLHSSQQQKKKKKGMSSCIPKHTL